MLRTSVHRHWIASTLFAVALIAVAQPLLRPAAWGQQTGEGASESDAGPSGEPPPATSDGNSTDDGNAGAAGTSAATKGRAGGAQRSREINVFELAGQGGIFMYPIYALSLLAVGVIVERFLALRTERVLPGELVAALGQLGNSKSGFDPKRAYRICQQFPSAAANVIRAMLLKVGRPHSEVEHTVAETSEREANRLYRNVRWLNMAAAVTPLIGLLGTVQGMIVAFHQTTVLAPGANKAVELANGIYTALVTTFGGLCVAIPSAFFAHYFEGRIQGLFHQIDELLFSLLPLTERYENRVRFGRQLEEGPDASGEGIGVARMEGAEAPATAGTRAPDKPN